MKRPSTIMRSGTLLTTTVCTALLLFACTGNDQAELNPTMIGDVADAPPTLVDMVSPASGSTSGTSTNAADETTPPSTTADETGGEPTSEAATGALTLSLPPGDIERGRSLVAVCIGCHSVSGSPGVGPSWAGLYGHEVTLSDGTTVVADDAYIAQSILDPSSQVVEGYAPAMPPFSFSDQELADIIAYIASLED